MNKALKQFLVFFIFVCIVMLTVLVVQVFIFGESIEPETELPDVISSETPPTESEAPPPVDTGESAPPTTDASTPPDDGTTSEPDDEESESPVQEGMVRVPLPLPDIGTLYIDYFDGVFTHSELDYGDLFMYISPSGGEASMTVLTKSNTTAAEAAPGFFDEAQPDETIQGGQKSIGRTGIIGQHVKAIVGDETFEAWIVDIEGDVIAFSIKYSNDEQMTALYELIDFMRLAQ